MSHLRRTHLPVLGLLCLAALSAAPALAAGKAGARPTISSVGPRSAALGDTITIRGHNFLSGSSRNTVTFKHDGGPAISVKSGASTPTRIAVVVPASLEKQLTVSGGAAQPTRFRVRVRARLQSKRYTPLKQSLVVTSPDVVDASPDDCAASGAADGVTGIAGISDILDGPLADLLGDTLNTLATLLPIDPCAADPAVDDTVPADPAADDSVG
jgi:hypothetical protein